MPWGVGLGNKWGLMLSFVYCISCGGNLSNNIHCGIFQYIPYSFTEQCGKQNKINFLTLSLGIVTVLLSLHYSFYEASSGTECSEENREMLFLQVMNICLMLLAALSCKRLTFYQFLPPQPLFQKCFHSGDQKVNIPWQSKAP